MSRWRPSRTSIRAALAAVCLWAIGSASPAQACAVCQGNPDDPMTRGAASGVIVLALVAYSVLLGFASMALYWVVRARRMYQTPTEAPPAAGAGA